ncbi:acyl-CoA dehydrogenase family protein [Catellatospora bangladeshensis]|uniref:Acyl-CoA dehydrogenase n=1 Tax=Catellatospora bangladeshensis TaxID=310355 RepID=A0A8J3JN89_9ACTN|nr:acyl-CoA dehydrogenase family protein [Catellatospora bangladeshensis]GIF83693.1 acyl-CoA dehydrogenase [Catellatospora bangladeshensis]
MEFGWTPEQQRRHADTVTAVREAFAQAPRGEGFYTRKDWLRLGELGLLGCSLPTEYGGGGLGALDTARQIEALGYGCPDTGLVFASSAHQFACAAPIAEFASEQAKRELLPGLCDGTLIAGNAMTEADAGSDVSRLAVTATETDGGWVLHGEKTFVSNGPAADVYVTYATTDPHAGHLGVTGFVVDRGSSGLTAGEPFDKMGLSSCPAGPVRFDGVFVPHERVLGVEGQGGAIFQQSMSWERTCLFAGYLGLLDRLVERAVTHARERRQFGRALADFQAVSHRIAEMKLRADTARLLLHRACWEMDQGGPRPMSVAMAKLAVSEGVLATALDAVRVFGGRGYQREDGIEAALRDAVPATIFSGTSDIQRHIIAKELGL